MQNRTPNPLQTQPLNGYAPHAHRNSQAEDRAWTFWEVMAEIYSNRWELKNGSAPSELWISQIGQMNSRQIMAICNALLARCAAGNSWPPDLAEFLTLAADNCGTALGLKTGDVMAEYWRWRRESYRYDSAVEFPWSHDVLYQICTEMRRTGTEQQMTEKELEALAGQLLAKWEKHFRDGHEIPEVRKQLEKPRRPTGPTPAELLMAKYRQQQAAKNSDKH